MTSSAWPFLLMPLSVLASGVLVIVVNIAACNRLRVGLSMVELDLIVDYISWKSFFRGIEGDEIWIGTYETLGDSPLSHLNLLPHPFL